MINKEVVQEAAKSVKEGIIMAMKITKAQRQLEQAIKEKMSTHLDSVTKGLNTVVTGNEVKLKDLYEKGQLESITLDDKKDLRSLKKELNRNGVKFSVMKDKASGDYVVFFQANSRKILNQAFKNALATEERKRPSTLKTLATYKE